MQVSNRFLSLLRFQLAQFADRSDLRSLVVYVAQSADPGTPTLVPIGQWPGDGRSLPALESNSPLRVPSEQRRWLPLRHQSVLLGAIQVETTVVPWPEPLAQRLQAVALCLTEALCLDLDQQRLQRTLNQQNAELSLLLHQLRNPLAALRTFGQLLLRRLDHDPRNRPLVEGLLAEERQLNRYVDALGQLGSRKAPALSGEASQPLLLPPGLTGPEGDPLATWLPPLLQRASATAALQGRPWQAPETVPDWRGDSGAVAEILANLLENAFRYSPAGRAVGLHCQALEDGTWQLTVWDGGPPISHEERAAIFERGFRGIQGQALPGTGLGLALARDLARSLGGDLRLLASPRSACATLPAEGNAFCLTLPAGPGSSGEH